MEISFGNEYLSLKWQNLSINQLEQMQELTKWCNLMAGGQEMVVTKDTRTVGLKYL